MRKVLITGGSGLIGFQLVKEMLNDNHFVMFTTRSKKTGNQLISKHDLNPKKCVPIELDFSNEGSLGKLKNHGLIDITQNRVKSQCFEFGSIIRLHV